MAHFFRRHGGRAAAGAAGRQGGLGSVAAAAAAICPGTCPHPYPLPGTALEAREHRPHLEEERGGGDGLAAFAGRTSAAFAGGTPLCRRSQGCGRRPGAGGMGEGVSDILLETPTRRMNRAARLHAWPICESLDVLQLKIMAAMLSAWVSIAAVVRLSGLCTTSDTKPPCFLRIRKAHRVVWMRAWPIALFPSVGTGPT